MEATEEKKTSKVNLEQIKAHIARIKTDNDYRRQFENTLSLKGEVADIDILVMHCEELVQEVEMTDRSQIIKSFVEQCERRAEDKMMITGKLEGAHYAAMKEILAELEAANEVESLQHNK